MKVVLLSLIFLMGLTLNCSAKDSDPAQKNYSQLETIAGKIKNSPVQLEINKLNAADNVEADRKLTKHPEASFDVMLSLRLPLRKKYDEALIQKARAKSSWGALVESYNRSQKDGKDTSGENYVALLESYFRFANEVGGQKIPDVNLEEQMVFNQMHNGKYLGESFEPVMVASCRTDIAIAARKRGLQLYNNLKEKSPQLLSQIKAIEVEKEMRFSTDLRPINKKCLMSESSNTTKSSKGGIQ